MEENNGVGFPERRTHQQVKRINHQPIYRPQQKPDKTNVSLNNSGGQLIKIHFNRQQSEYQVCADIVDLESKVIRLASERSWT